MAAAAGIYDRESNPLQGPRDQDRFRTEADLARKPEILNWLRQRGIEYKEQVSSLRTVAQRRSRRISKQ
jgi:hypothetical protein